MHRTAEFDAFGPWIYPVRTEADMPRLYQDAGIDVAAQRLVLKMPRAIERRNATADMHLYDVLIAVDDTTVTVLSRQGERYSTARLAITSLSALEDSTNLLDGRLVLHGCESAPVTIAYNAADLLPVHDLIQLLRELSLPGAERAGVDDQAEADVELGLGGRDRELAAAYRAVRRADPQLDLISAVPRQALIRAPGLNALVRCGFEAMTLHASIVMADDREVQLIHRRERLGRSRKDVHSIARTIVSRSRITQVETAAHEWYPEVEVVTVHSGQGQLRLPVLAGHPATALRSVLD